MTDSLQTDDCTIGNVFTFLKVEGMPADWPADVFAVVASILQRSGAYTLVVEHWPPDAHGRQKRIEWNQRMEGIGLAWRKTSAAGQAAPSEVHGWWQTVLASSNTSLRSVAGNQALREALFQLCAVADEASFGVGIPTQPAVPGPATDLYELAANSNLISTGSLCQRVHSSRVRVLPKLHSPRSGMTLRSLTHNLSLYSSQDVIPEWRIFPGGPEESRGLNLLLLPWPLEVDPDQFKELKGPLANMPEKFGFFGYFPRTQMADWIKKGKAAYEAAKLKVGTIHGVVLPELALNQDEFRQLSSLYCGKRGSFVISGVGEPVDELDSPKGYAKNYLRFEVPMGSRATGLGQQNKHHRWKLERNQILQYGCGANLNHDREWWEYIGLRQRTVTFVSMNPWLTIVALICEDLARQDPVSEVIRTVGPNLVIALLMDGPQLSSRWSARYATVFADDPGCSVLTLTSIGMALLSRPAGKPASRVVALWKDALTSGPVEIELPDGADGIVLTLSNEFQEEWAADGRTDGGTTGYPILAGVHPVFSASADTRPTLSRGRPK